MLAVPYFYFNSVCVVMMMYITAVDRYTCIMSIVVPKSSMECYTTYSQMEYSITCNHMYVHVYPTCYEFIIHVAPTTYIHTCT